MIRLGIIGYGVRVDMLMDSFITDVPDEVKIQAITDIDFARVRALMLKNDTPEKMHQFEIDKIDGLLRQCPMNPDEIAFYADADEMMDKEDLDGVIVGTNCDTHTFFAKKVLEHNLPLFLEKPVATIPKDLKVLTECAKIAKVPTVVSFPLRATKIIQQVKQIIDLGTIGPIDHIQAYNDVSYGFVYFHDWYRNEKIANGLFMQKATHDIDVINYLTGQKPVKVCAMKSKQIYKGEKPAGLRCSECDEWRTCMDSTYNITHTRNDTPRSDYCAFAVDTGNEDSGSVIIRYESGMHAVYSQNFFARKGAARRGMRLYGYNGTIEFNFITDDIKIFDHMSDKTTYIKINTPPSGHGGGDTILAQNFVDLIQGRTTCSISPLEAGIESALVCMKAKESSEKDEFCAIER